MGSTDANTTPKVDGVPNRVGLGRLADLTPARLRRVPRSASRRTRTALGINGGGYRAAPKSELTPRVDAFISILGMLPAGRVLDLGAGHALFSRYALAMGWEVTAQDVRATRFPDDPRGIRWLTGDVLDLRIEKGAYDLVLCLGLLYHLDLPGQLSLLRNISHTPLLLDTHTSSATDPDPSPHAHLLGPVVNVDGYTGRYYQEVSGAADTERKAVATASWDNPMSFWPTHDSQVTMLRNCGYDQVLTDEHAYSPGRAFQLCIPKKPSPSVIERGSRRGPLRRETAAAVKSFLRRSAARPAE